MSKLSVPFLVWLAAVGSLQATSIRFKKFSTPLFQKDRLICTSPDSKRVLCIGPDGTQLWEKSFTETVYLIEGPDSEPLLQKGRVVNLLLKQSGDLEPRFTVEDRKDVVSYVKESGVFVSRDRSFEGWNFKLLDEKTGKPFWRNTGVEKLISVTPELIVTLAVRRIPSSPGYTFGKTSLEAFDRNAFKKMWSIPIALKGSLPILKSALKAPYLIYTEGNSLTVLERPTGRKLLTKAMELPEYGRISDVQIHGGHVVWLSSNALRFCTLPGLEERKTVALRLLEPGSQIAFEGEFIISDALYRVGCFRMNGEKVWERFKSNRTESIDNRIYFSDQDKSFMRLGYVEVPTGKETILYSEEVK